MVYNEISELQKQNAKHFSVFETFLKKNKIPTICIVCYKVFPYSIIAAKNLENGYIFSISNIK